MTRREQTYKDEHKCKQEQDGKCTQDDENDDKNSARNKSLSEESDEYYRCNERTPEETTKGKGGVQGSEAGHDGVYGLVRRSLCTNNGPDEISNSISIDEAQGYPAGRGDSETLAPERRSARDEASGAGDAKCAAKGACGSASGDEADCVTVVGIGEPARRLGANVILREGQRGHLADGVEHAEVGPLRAEEDNQVRGVEVGGAEDICVVSQYASVDEGQRVHGTFYSEGSLDVVGRSGLHQRAVDGVVRTHPEQRCTVRTEKVCLSESGPARRTAPAENVEAAERSCRWCSQAHWGDALPTILWTEIAEEMKGEVPLATVVTYSGGIVIIDLFCF
eukprot:PhM_4_TR11631/c3_g2_i4/m.6237